MKSMKQKIKVIFFDIGGVYVNSSGISAVKRFAEVLGKEYSEIRDIFVEIWEEFATGRMSNEDYYKNLSLRLGIDTKTLAEIWTSDEMFAINPGVEALIVKLKKNGYIAATITDVDPVHLKIHMERGTYGIFEFVIDSVNAKSTKRSGKEIYEKALEIAKAKPQECIMIDDTPEKLVAARDLGMHTIPFKDAKQLGKELRGLGVKV